MIIFTPSSPLEAAVLRAGRFTLGIDSSGRAVLSVGHRRLPNVVLRRSLDGLSGLLRALAEAEAEAGAFTVVEGEGGSSEIEPVGPGDETREIAAAEEYLVVGLRPLISDGRPVRVVAGREVVRLQLMPWWIPARTVGFGGRPHYLVTSARGVVGDWEPAPDGRRGVVVGVPEAWLGLFERLRRDHTEIVLRANAPVPWVGDDGIAGAVPTTVGLFEREIGDGGPAVGGTADGGTAAGGTAAGGTAAESWLATLPVVMTEGDVVRPVDPPDGVDVGPVPAGRWELEARGVSDFAMSSLR